MMMRLEKEIKKISQKSLNMDNCTLKKYQEASDMFNDLIKRGLAKPRGNKIAENVDENLVIKYSNLR